MDPRVLYILVPPSWSTKKGPREGPSRSMRTIYRSITGESRQIEASRRHDQRPGAAGWGRTHLDEWCPMLAAPFWVSLEQTPSTKEFVRTPVTNVTAGVSTRQRACHRRRL